MDAYWNSGKPLLFDGAMGTYLAALTGETAEGCERANLDHPELVRAVHEAYLKAGCQAIKTNTFSCGADLAEGKQNVSNVVEAGCRLAREAAAPRGLPPGPGSGRPRGALVFADIGPVPLEEGLSPAKIYIRLADLFLEQGVTNFLVETLAADDGIPELARHLKARCPEAFLIVSFAVGSDGITREGHEGRELFCRTAALPEVDAVGFNCMSGPQHLLEYIRSLNLGNTHLSIMPNAGYPAILGRHTVYQGRPDYFARKMAEIVQAGASIVGGCCGTTPDHIARMVSVLAQPLPQDVESSAEAARAVSRRPDPNPLWEKLEQGKRVIAVELDPPLDDDLDAFLQGVRTLREAGADAVTIADCPVGRARMDSSLLACKVKRELGMEPLPHMACRDRNLNATKALLLGLSAEGVHNVLLVTGDPIPTEERDEVKSVFNFNSRKLARYIGGLNESTLTTPFRMYGALNLNARNFEAQLKQAVEKEESGMSGFLTQPVLSAEALENLKLARQTQRGQILGGVFPVVSYRNACFLNNEISGMRVCPEIIERYRDLDREAGEDLAVRISTQVIREIAPYTDGLYLMTPFKRVKLIEKILKAM